MSTPLPLKVLLAAQLPPPVSGIGNWTLLIRREAATRHQLSLNIVNMAVRWRRITNVNPVVRLAGGSIHACRDIIRLMRQVYRFKPDTLHLTTSASFSLLKDNVILALASRHCHNTIVHFHFGRIPAIQQRNTIEWRLLQQAVRRARTAIVLDTHSCLILKDSVGHRCNAQIIAIPNLVDVDQVDTIAPITSREPCQKGPRIVYAGHVVKTKGISELVGACARLRKDTQLDLELIGPCESDYAHELSRIAGGSTASEWLHFRGEYHGEYGHDTVIAWLKSAELVVLPSYSEGFPNVILEAMACRKAIVATDVGAIGEMLEPANGNEYGYLIPPRNTDMLLTAMHALVHDSNRRNTMGIRARERVEQRYKLQNVFERYMKLWQAEPHGSTVGYCPSA